MIPILFALSLDLPVIDMPFNESDGYTAPSMAQSLAVTRDFYTVAHYEIGKALNPDEGTFGQRFGARLALYSFDGLSMLTPLGLSWMHEEWHRAVMSRRGVSSHDDIYDMKPSTLIAVSHESDADLEDLKARHPRDQVRLAEAGMESQHQLTSALENDLFFSAPKLDHHFLLLLNELQVEGYLFTCTGKSADTSTDKQNRDDGASVAKRDFTGLDCDGWVYDLFRPNEPFASRGVHPSGVGVNRYRRFSDLSGAERDYLVLQRQLGLLNFVDPFLLRIPAFEHDGHRFTGTFRHYLTAFGYSVDMNFLATHAGREATHTLHVYRNGQRAFLGAEAGLLHLDSGSVDLAPRVGLWQQPDDLRFNTSAARAGGFVATRARFKGVGTAWANPYVEMLAKTEGWLAGEVSLEPGVSWRVGVETPL